MRFCKAIFFVSSLLLMTVTANSQVTNASLIGTITDASGAVIPGASVSVVDSATNSRRTVQTAEDGLYVVENLQPGTFNILVSKQGFKAKNVTGVVLRVAQRARVNIMIDVGETSEKVEVQGGAPIIETENSSVGKVIESREVTNLPLNGRQFLQLATLTPGVQKTYQSNHETTGGSVSVNGMSLFSNNTMVDGVMNQETGAGRMTFSPSVDLIQEFKIQSNTYDAEYGRTGGAQIEVITKRGTQNYHGSVYEFVRNNALDARPEFQSGPLPHFSRNQFGGTFGGHLPHSTKDFFFASYEGLRSNQGLTAVMSVPTSSIRNGDFSGVGTIIYDPQTLDPSTGQRQPFPNNVIPANRISPVTSYFLNTFIPSVPDGSPISNNFVSNPVQSTEINQIAIRYDRDFSSHDTVMARFTRNKYHSVLPRGDSGVATPLDSLSEDIHLTGDNDKVGWTHVFGATTVNDFNVGYSRYYQDRWPVTRGKGYITKSGLQGVTQVDAGIPTFNISGFSTITDNFVSPINQPFANYVLSDTFSKVWGKHALRFGGSFLYNRTQSELDLFDRGTMNSSPRYTTAAVGAPGNQYNAFAEFLLGLPSSTSIWQNKLYSDWRSHTTSGFIQDNWNVTANLTLNLGMRYDVYTKPFDTENRMSAFDIETQEQAYPGSVPDLPGVPPGSIVAEDHGYPRNLQFPTTFNNWAPRVGFAWRPFRTGKTALRGGYGLFYNWLVIDSATNLSIGAPWVPATSITCNADVPCVTAMTPYSSTVVAGFSSNVASKTNRNPYVHQFSLGIQQEITPTMSLELGYVGNLAEKNLIRLNINQPLPGPGSIASRRPYPTLGTLNAIETIGTSNYNSFQANLRKNYDKTGLVLITSYTWSHALGDSISGPQISEGQPLRDFRNYKAEYGNTPYDRRHILSVSWVYEMPFGKGKYIGGNLDGIANTIIGGWRFEGISSAFSGQSLTPTDIVDVSNAGGSRPDVVGDPNSISHSDRQASIKQWFNTSAFVRAPQYTFGNSGVGIIRGPGFVNFDLSLQKLFAITEGSTLQFRAEFFNAFNHPNLGNPATSFGAANFGTISSIVGTARDIQLGLRYQF